MISYSFSFGARARCKYCLSGPKYATHVFSGNFTRDILDGLKKSINYLARKPTCRSGLATTNYLFVPNKATKLSYSSFNMAFSSVNVRRYKSIIPASEINKFIFRSSYSCECMKTAWVTREMLILDKDHISQRLSLNSYPIDVIKI